jgi:CRISPR/Cas system-associated exonuclease Cas4 (RecB family)
MEYPKAVNNVIGRLYEIEKGIFVPSVTTVIQWGCPMPIHLLNWIIKTSQGDPDKYWNVRNRDAQIGIDAHNLVELFAKRQMGILTDEELETYKNISIQDEPLQKALTCFIDFFIKYKPKFLEVETPLFHRDIPFAGRIDAIAEIDGETWLLDYKTSRSVDKDMKIKMQLSAYARLYEKVGEHKIDRMGVIHLKKNFVPGKDGFPSKRSKYLYEYERDDSLMDKALDMFNLFYDQLDSSGKPKTSPELEQNFGMLFEGLLGGQNV